MCNVNDAMALDELKRVETANKKYTVYKHIAPDGRVYIGITSLRVTQRWDCGRGYRNNAYFTRVINKYGWDSFKHEIIASDLSEKQAKKLEIQLISEYKSNDRKHGFNISSGGESHAGTHISDWQKQRISEASKGRVVSAETRSKLSVASKRTWQDKDFVERLRSLNLGENNPQYGIKRTDNEKLQRGAKRVIQKDMDGNIISTFISIHQANDFTNIPRDTISKCCKGIFKQAGGYLWEFQ